MSSFLHQMWNGIKLSPEMRWMFLNEWIKFIFCWKALFHRRWKMKLSSLKSFKCRRGHFRPRSIAWFASRGSSFLLRHFFCFWQGRQKTMVATFNPNCLLPGKTNSQPERHTSDVTDLWRQWRHNLLTSLTSPTCDVTNHVTKLFCCRRVIARLLDIFRLADCTTLLRTSPVDSAQIPAHHISLSGTY